MTKFFEFSQNNSGGSFDINDETGIGPRVWIEARDYAHANTIAERIGIYFDGVDADMDCPCCGDRWYALWDGEEGEQNPTLDPRWDFNWHGTVYVHRLNGTIDRLTKDDATIG